MHGGWLRIIAASHWPLLPSPSSPRGGPLSWTWHPAASAAPACHVVPPRGVSTLPWQSLHPSACPVLLPAAAASTCQAPILTCACLLSHAMAAYFLPTWATAVHAQCQSVSPHLQVLLCLQPPQFLVHQILLERIEPLHDLSADLRPTWGSNSGA